MSETKATASSSGIGFFGLLAILFIGLKLTGHIDWSWFWVLSPLWGGFILTITVLLVVLILAVALDDGSRGGRLR